MKTMIVIAMMMAACATDPTSTTTQGLICGPYCDPASIQDAATAFGEALFFDTQFLGGTACGQNTQDETICSATYSTCQLSCATWCCVYVAWCSATQCGWYQ